ncbi:MAG: replicative DNA helicase [Candidatus Cloacimonetes bacterium]|nr:replicative DNA helicase [Candidatus Cloacimonadota bacterium]
MRERILVTDKPLPSDLDIESTILNVAINDNTALSMMLEQVTAQDFYSSKNSDLFSLIAKMVEKKIAVDIISVDSEIKARCMEDRLGSVIVDISDKICAIENYESKLHILTGISMLRKLVRAAAEITRMSFMPDDYSFDEVADQAEGLIRDATARIIKSEEVDMNSVMGSVFAYMESFHRGAISRILTGFTKLDTMLSIDSTDFIILAGRPSMGKTAFVAALAKSIAKSGTGVGIFSLEMSSTQLGQRLICDEAEVSIFLMRNNKLPKRDYPKLSMAAGLISELPIIIDDTPIVTLGVVRSKIRKWISKHNIKLIIIDYLQLMQTDDKLDQNRSLEKLSRGLKLTCKEFGVPIIALSQLSRENTKRGKNTRPMLSDLRGSGAIEQDADTVMFIHRQHVYDENHPKEDAEIIIAKQRNGPCETVHLEFKPEFAGFRDVKEQTEWGDDANS